MHYFGTKKYILIIICLSILSCLKSGLKVAERFHTFTAFIGLFCDFFFFTCKIFVHFSTFCTFLEHIFKSSILQRFVVCKKSKLSLPLWVLNINDAIISSFSYTIFTSCTKSNRPVVTPFCQKAQIQTSISLSALHNINSAKISTFCTHLVRFLHF